MSRCLRLVQGRTASSPPYSSQCPWCLQDRTQTEGCREQEELKTDCSVSEPRVTMFNWVLLLRGYPGNELALTNVCREGDFVDSRVQVDDIRWSFLGVKMSRQPLKKTNTDWNWNLYERCDEEFYRGDGEQIPTVYFCKFISKSLQKASAVRADTWRGFVLKFHPFHQQFPVSVIILSLQLSRTTVLY